MSSLSPEGSLMCICCSSFSERDGTGPGDGEGTFGVSFDFLAFLPLSGNFLAAQLSSN